MKYVRGLGRTSSRNRGFTLLYAIIMVSAVLFITTAALFFLTRQIRFATVSNDSQNAYYAAESAGECVLAYAQAGVFDKGLIQDIICDGVLQGQSNGQLIQTFTIIVTNPSTGLQAKAEVTVNVTTQTIESVGYNSPDDTLPTRLQRAITFKYKMYCPIGGDVMIVVDRSGSISPAEMQVYKASLKYLIDRIYEIDEDHTTKVGLIEYSSRVKVTRNLRTLDSAYRTTLKGDIDGIVPAGEGGGGRTHTSLALRNAYLQFNNLEDTDQNTPGTGILNSSGNEIQGGYVGLAGGDPEIGTISPAVNRDDDLYSNHVLLFTDGSPNDWIATSTVVVNGQSKPRGFWADSGCYWNANGSVFIDNATGTGCEKNSVMYKITTMYGFLEEAERLKEISTLYTVAIGMAVDRDGIGTTLCMPGVTCHDLMRQAATTDNLSWIANEFDEDRLNEITEEIIACNIPISGGGSATTVTISGASPNGQTFPQGTTNVDLAVNTNTVATCEYSSSSNMAGALPMDTVGGVSHTKTLSGFTDGNSYTRYVRCSKAGIQSAVATLPFSIASGSDTQAPSVPGTVAGSAVSGTQINVTWNASTDNTGVTSYNIERCSGASCTSWAAVGTVAVTSFSDTGLTADTQYRYRVRARDASGNASAYSSPITVATQSVSTGLIGHWTFDSNLNSSVGGYTGAQTGGATVNATAPKVGSGSLLLDGVDATVSTGDVTEMNNASKVSVSLWFKIGTAPGSAYEYLVSKYATGAKDFILAFNNSSMNVDIGNGTSDSYAEWSYGSNLPVNTWHHAVVVFDGTQTAANRVKLYVNNVARSLTVIGTFPTVTHADLAGDVLRFGARDGNVGYFDGRIDDVQVYNKALSAGEISNIFNGTSGGDVAAPSVPTGLTATPVSSSQINLSWTASTDAVGVTGYEVQQCLNSSCTWGTIGTPSGTTLSSTGLSAGTTYRYQVRARDAAGNWSAYSTVVNGTTQTASDTTAPSVPSGLSLQGDTTTRVDISWTASTDNVGVSNYTVQRCTGASCTSWATVASPTGVTNSDTGLTAGTVYRYRVRAVDADSNTSGYSAILDTATIPTSGLVGHWAFDTASGGSTADSVNGNNGTLTAATIVTGQKKIGAGSANFNGTSAYISAGDPASGVLDLGDGSFSMSVWIRKNAWNTTEGNERIISKETSANEKEYSLNIANSGLLRFEMETGGNNSKVETGTGVIGLNTWKHVLVTFNGTSRAVTIYVDGVAQSTTGSIGALATVFTAPLQFGRLNYGGGSQYYTGHMDQVRLYSRVLNATEIAALVNELP